MDVSNVPNDLNDPKDIILLSSFATNHAGSSNNTPPEPPIVGFPCWEIRKDVPRNREHAQGNNVHRPRFVLPGRNIQPVNAELVIVGILAIPVIRKAMFKIFERHL